MFPMINQRQLWTPENAYPGRLVCATEDQQGPL